MKRFVDQSTDLSKEETATLYRAVSRAVKSIFERESSPLKRRILLDTIPLKVYGNVLFATLSEEERQIRIAKKKKAGKKQKKSKKVSSKS